LIYSLFLFHEHHRMENVNFQIKVKKNISSILNFIWKESICWPLSKSFSQRFSMVCLSQLKLLLLNDLNAQKYLIFKWIKIQTWLIVVLSLKPFSTYSDKHIELVVIVFFDRTYRMRTISKSKSNKKYFDLIDIKRNWYLVYLS
jgi:hypothetical protein